MGELSPQENAINNFYELKFIESFFATGEWELPELNRRELMSVFQLEPGMEAAHIFLGKTAAKQSLAQVRREIVMMENEIYE